MDLVQVRVEDRLGNATVLTPGRTTQPGIDAACPSRECHDGHGQGNDGRAEAHDEESEVGLDERVEVDPMVLRWGRPSLAGPR